MSCALSLVLVHKFYMYIVYPDCCFVGRFLVEVKSPNQVGYVGNIKAFNNPLCLINHKISLDSVP